MNDTLILDIRTPKTVAAHLEEFSVGKATLPPLLLALLGVLAGSFISLGSLMFALVYRAVHRRPVHQTCA